MAQFTDLARELRIRIYVLCLANPPTLKMLFTGHQIHSDQHQVRLAPWPYTPLSTNLLALLRVNKMFVDEAGPIFYGSSHLNSINGSSNGLEKFLVSIGANAQNISHFQIRFPNMTDAQDDAFRSFFPPWDPQITVLQQYCTGLKTIALIYSCKFSGLKLVEEDNMKALCIKVDKRLKDISNLEVSVHLEAGSYTQAVLTAMESVGWKLVFDTNPPSTGATPSTMLRPFFTGFGII